MKKSKDAGNVMDQWAAYMKDGQHSAKDWDRKNDHMFGMLISDAKKNDKRRSARKWIKRIGVAAILIIAILYLLTKV